PGNGSRGGRARETRSPGSCSLRGEGHDARPAHRTRRAAGHGRTGRLLRDDRRRPARTQRRDPRRGGGRRRRGEPGIMKRRPFAVYSITKHGLEIGARLAQALPGSDLFVSEKLMIRAPNGAKPVPLPMGPLLADTFTAYDCHVFVISVGAVV